MNTSRVCDPSWTGRHLDSALGNGALRTPPVEHFVSLSGPQNKKTPPSTPFEYFSPADHVPGQRVLATHPLFSTDSGQKLPLVNDSSSSLSSCLVLPGCVLPTGWSGSSSLLGQEFVIQFVLPTSRVKSSVLRNTIAIILPLPHCSRTQKYSSRLIEYEN